MKDPAALFYIDKWFLATKEMRADCRGWFLNLILHQFDKTDLPNDLEELANLADVRISEYDKFKQVFEQVLKQKFEQNEKGRLENPFAAEILKGRELFKEKRSDAGKLSYVLKYFRANFKYNKGFEEYVKQNLIIDFDIKSEQVLKQVFEQTLELYINVNVNVNKDIIKDINTREQNFKIELSQYEIEYGNKTIEDFFNYWTEKNGTRTKMLFEMQKTWDTKKRLARWSSHSFGKIIPNKIDKFDQILKDLTNA